ncbi:di-heme oxidoredictase family protein [Lentisphaera profundi]|uniref:Di-heme oxidoredictase family protein n=1 Tax=Lentisphaera profundi TaxID=1658616 RepID=A0ABY7VZU6_9BACT|nr:di-heme oxidoredictase family protein [Lentisphaera profundi]WDE99232.1 di-heme oxidoredictase family protein [Lentisphaera profundi]
MRTRLTLVLLLLSCFIWAENSEKLGGDLTVYKESKYSFGMSAPNIPIKNLRDFAFGNRMFNTNWVTAPSSVPSLDGLGPLFNRVACSQCHLRDGRGRAPHDSNEMMNSMLVRMSAINEKGEVIDHPIYGGQLSDRAIQDLKAEARVRVSWHESQGQFADGQTYSLRKPQYKFEFFRGDAGEFLFSPRVTPAVYGLGLLEALDEKSILTHADPEDQDGDGISGKANYVWDAVSKSTQLGRFGLKANAPNLLHQNTGAANGDIGLTSKYFPKKNHQVIHKDLENHKRAGFDLSEEQARRLTLYIQSLGVPVRRNMDDEQAKQGEKFFKQINCQSCHVESFTTGKDHELEFLRNQQIFPYTDLLLHDMGADLADNRPDGLANGFEWRTPPLWGLGLHKMVNGNDYFLHDGRARTIEEAILWHGGEAEASRDAYKKLNKEERESLMKFLKSL